MNGVLARESETQSEDVLSVGLWEDLVVADRIRGVLCPEDAHLAAKCVRVGFG